MPGFRFSTVQVACNCFRTEGILAGGLAVGRMIMFQKKRLGNNETVRSVERAIELLQALNRNPLSSIGDLHRATGIPKSTILRLLRTLEAKGLVAQTSSYSSYRLLEAVTSLSCGEPYEPLIIDIAERAMTEVTRQEGWPLALALFDANMMVVRASTIPAASLYDVHSSLYVRLALADYALGRAFLAYCTPREQKILLEFAGFDMGSDGQADARTRRILDILKTIRETGYAIRDPSIRPQSSTLAVPVFDNGRVTASLGLTWLPAAVPVEEAIARYVPRLTAIAEKISRELANRSGSVPKRLHGFDEQGGSAFERASSGLAP